MQSPENCHHTFNNFAFRVCFAGLDHFVVGGEELEAVLLRPVRHLPHPDVLQRDDAPWLLVRRELEVVEAIVVQDKPPPFPALVAASLLPEPALPIGVEEGVHEVVAVVLGDLEGLGFDAVVERHEELAGQVAPVVDPAVHGDELVDGRLVLDARVVQGRVQHDDGERQDVARVGVGENIGVELAISKNI